ncbi:Luciferase OS=Streptomyces fumanus OX=67302 GN=GCM10018772_36610 PE=4 SV=1 [Streptomyces fumanus]
MPEFKERHERAERAKAARLAPALDAALARREPPAANPPYVIPARSPNPGP